MTLDELLALDEIEDVADWREQVKGEVDTLTAGMTARTEELQSKLDAAERKATELAARNYELIVAATADPEPAPDPGQDEDDTEITDLFEKEN